ncbi:MAG: hypothetical protein GEV09_00530 [Pseudonocardiaceae bacterium]|nr:hypothetical protein [Pseudonocardiaceae bacterium]
MKREALRPVLLSVALACLFSLVNPVPAAAHIAGSGGSPSNFRTVVTDVRPATPGVDVTVGVGGQWVRITNRDAGTIVVLGYRGEPFLRLSQDQVQANQRSITAAEAGLTRRTAAAPDAQPRWQPLSDGGSVTWADARIDPPPDQSDVPGAWQLPLVVDGQQVTVSGDRDRIPPPSPWPWLAGLALIAAGVAVLGWMRHWHRPLAAAVAAGVLAFGLHLIGTGFAPQRVGAVFGWVAVGAVGLFSVAIGAVAVVSTLRRRESAAPRIITIATMVLLLAAGDITVLWNSQLPFAGPPVLDRILMMLTYGIVLGLLVAGVRLAREPTHDELGEQRSSG